MNLVFPSPFGQLNIGSERLPVRIREGSIGGCRAVRDTTWYASYRTRFAGSIARRHIFRSRGALQNGNHTGFPSGASLETQLIPCRTWHEDSRIIWYPQVTFGCRIKGMLVHATSHLPQRTLRRGTSSPETNLSTKDTCFNPDLLDLSTKRWRRALVCQIVERRCSARWIATLPEPQLFAWPWFLGPQVGLSFCEGTPCLCLCLKGSPKETSHVGLGTPRWIPIAMIGVPNMLGKGHQSPTAAKMESILQPQKSVYQHTSPAPCMFLQFRI